MQRKEALQMYASAGLTRLSRATSVQPAFAWLMRRPSFKNHAMSEISTYDGQELPFDQLAKAIAARRSLYGRASGLAIDRAERGEAWSRLPYQSVFVGDVESGVIHGGVVTAMLDESCGMAVQLALDGSRAIATLDLRIDYQKPAKPGLDIKAHAICYHVTRSIAFVRA